MTDSNPAPDSNANTEKKAEEHLVETKVTDKTISIKARIDEIGIFTFLGGFSIAIGLFCLYRAYASYGVLEETSGMPLFTGMLIVCGILHLVESLGFFQFRKWLPPITFINLVIIVLFTVVAYFNHLFPYINEFGFLSREIAWQILRIIIWSITLTILWGILWAVVVWYTYQHKDLFKN